MLRIPLPRAVGGALLAATSLAVHANAFHTFDPVSMGLGGTGVAFADPANGVLVNPAALSAMPESSTFNFSASASGRVFDEDDLFDEVDDFQDAGYVDALDSSIATAESALAAYASSGSTSDRNQAVAALRVTSSDTRNLNDGLISVAGRPAEAEVGAALAGSRPSRSFGIGVVASVWGTVSGTSEYDDTFLSSVADDIDVCANDLDAGNACDSNNLTYLSDTDGDGTPDTINLDPNSDLNSRVFGRGLLVQDVGITVSHAFDLGGRAVAIGVTPKSQRVHVFDYVANVDSADAGDIDADAQTRDYSDFNMDLGVLTRFGAIATGLTVRNAVEHEYETVLGNTVKIEPQARAGVAYQADWYRLGADLDLTRNASSGFADDTQFASVGGAVNVLGTLQLRAGYRWDTVSDGRNTASLGLGLSPFGVGHLDIAVAGNDSEVGLAGNFGLTF